MKFNSRKKAITWMTDRLLLDEARKAAKKAYAPYSRFKVGAAVLAADGRIFFGCNVENASYGLSMCAERNAVAKAVSEGARDFEAIAVCADTTGPVTPCGACRQVLSEFSPSMRVIMAGRSGKARTAALDRLLPESFGPGYLRKRAKKRIGPKKHAGKR